MYLSMIFIIQGPKQSEFNANYFAGWCISSLFCKKPWNMLILNELNQFGYSYNEHKPIYILKFQWYDL